MKKLFYSFAMLIALVGCSGGDDPVVEEPTTGNDAIPAAGITVESPEGLSFAWEEGSTISLFRSKTNEKFVYNSASNEFVKTDKLEKKEPMEKDTMSAHIIAYMNTKSCGIRGHSAINAIPMENTTSI